MASRVDLEGILTNIKTILTAANTTTGSPIDLSANLSRRVSTLQTVNPQKLQPEASVFPLVTCYVTSKKMEDKSIATSQASLKRKAEVEIDVVGAIWNDTFNTAHDDPADKDIHYLMENIELILRSNENLSGAVTWQLAQRCDYYDVRVSEDSHLRSGILGLKATVFY